MRFLSDPSLPGHGIVTGVFFKRDGSIVAVASSFHWLTNPPARASYDGQHLRHRVALYRPPDVKPFAVFDSLRFPVNDVAFHPFEQTVAIATGSYDGGFLFEGQLVVWDWKKGPYSDRIGPIPEVVRTAFSNDGAHIVSFVRPWNEDLENEAFDSFNAFYEVRATYSEELFEGIFNEDSIKIQIDRQAPKTAEDVARDPRFRPLEADSEAALQRAFSLSEIKSRSAIWDVAWLDNNDIAIVHNDCQLEIMSPEGITNQRFEGETYGAQILKGHSLFVHAARFNPQAQDWDTAYSAHLLRYNGADVTEVANFAGAFTFSVSRDGWILGRRSRSPSAKAERLDVIGSPTLETWARHNVGHYDVFNHFLRIDGAPDLFAVQGTPPSSHEYKQVCVVSHDGSVKPLWPIVSDTGSGSHHAMECAFGYVADSVGEGIIASGKYFNPGPRLPYDGFIIRKRLHDGKGLWRHATKAGATTIKAIPGTEVILAAFLNGEFAAIDSTSGEILQWTDFRPDGSASVIFSFDVTARDILIGTIDGRVGIIAVNDFLKSGFS